MLPILVFPHPEYWDNGHAETPYCVMLRMELRALDMLGKHSTAEPLPQDIGGYWV